MADQGTEMSFKKEPIEVNYTPKGTKKSFRDVKRKDTDTEIHLEQVVSDETSHTSASSKKSL